MSLLPVALAVPLVLSIGGCFSPDRMTGTGEAGSDTDAATGTGADTSSSGGDDAPLSCAQYCTLVADHCEGDLQQYPGSVECEMICASLPPGTAQDTLGNTLGCRVYHAGNAVEDPAGHCRHAGPGGDGVCGGNCESFCTLAAELCTGDNAQFASTEECVSECAQFPTDPPFNATIMDGDSFACRLYHLSVAALQPATHCHHIGLVSDVCF